VLKGSSFGTLLQTATATPVAIGAGATLDYSNALTKIT
jgi:hypothetical protein